MASIVRPRPSQVAAGAEAVRRVGGGVEGRGALLLGGRVRGLIIGCWRPSVREGRANTLESLLGALGPHSVWASGGCPDLAPETMETLGRRQWREYWGGGGRRNLAPSGLVLPGQAADPDGCEQGYRTC